MSTHFYARASHLSGRLRTRLAALAAGLLLAPAAWAQIEVPAGNPNAGSGRRPLGTWFGYERSALIYTAAEIGTSGNLTQIDFFVNAVSAHGAAPTKVYLKTVSNASFTAPTTVAEEEAGATLVFDATIPATSFMPNRWVTLPLTAPFAYDGTSNLEVIVETNATGAGNELASSKAFRYSSTGTSNRAQFWVSDNTAPLGLGVLSLLRPNIRLTGLAPLTCAPVNGLSVSSVTATSAQVSFTPGASYTSYTVSYTPAGGTPTTVTPAPTTSPVNLTGLTPGTAYTVTVAGNCTGGTTSPAATISFNTALTCAPVTAVSASNITINSAQIAFTPGNGNTSYTVSYTPAGGTPTTVTPAPTASPVSLTGLTSGTTYTVTIVGNCTGGATAPAATVSFTTASPPPPNDECAAATVLAPTATCTPTITTNLGATASMGVPPPNSTGTGCFLAGTPVSNDVWYSIVVPASGGFTLTTSAVAGSNLSDTGLVLYTGTCGALTEVACSNDEGEGSFSTIRAIGLTPGATVYARVWSFGTSPTGPFGICVVPVPANNAVVRALYTLGKVPTGVAHVVQAIVTNAGAQTLINLPVTLNVTGATMFDDGIVIASLAPGASTTVSFAPYTPTATGTNTLTVRVPADEVTTNDSQTYPQLVTAHTLSYLAEGQPLTASVGVSGTTPGGILAVKYVTSTASPLADVKLNFRASAGTTSTYQVVVLNATAAGLPGTVVFTSPTLARPATASVVTVPVTGTTVTGPFFVGLREISGNVGIGYQVEDPLRPATFYYQAPAASTWNDIITTPLKTRIGIDVTFSGSVTTTHSAALNRALSLYPNPSQGRLTLDIRQATATGPLQVQVTNLLGQLVHTATVRDNAQNPLDLSALAPGVYTVRVTAGSEYTLRQLVLTK